MPKKRRKITEPENRTAELLEVLAIVQLYLTTDLTFGEIAQRLGMGKQRVNAILKGIRKP